MVCSIPPKILVSDFMGLLKGKLAIRIFQFCPDLKQKPWGNHFWTKGYFISTIGLDEDMIRRLFYINKRKNLFAIQAVTPMVSDSVLVSIAHLHGERINKWRENGRCELSLTSESRGYMDDKKA